MEELRAVLSWRWRRRGLSLLDSDTPRDRGRNYLTRRRSEGDRTVARAAAEEAHYTLSVNDKTEVGRVSGPRGDICEWSGQGKDVATTRDLGPIKRGAGRRGCAFTYAL